MFLACLTVFLRDSQAFLSSPQITNQTTDQQQFNHNTTQTKKRISTSLLPTTTMQQFALHLHRLQEIIHFLLSSIETSPYLCTYKRQVTPEGFSFGEMMRTKKTNGNIVNRKLLAYDTALNSSEIKHKHMS